MECIVFPTMCIFKVAAKNDGDRGCLLIAQMSSQGSLVNKSYVQSAYVQATKHSDFVMGFICQHRLTSDPRFLHFTPGVSIKSKGDVHGQVYNSPENAIQNGADILIVGRAITTSDNPAKEAMAIRELAYSIYSKNSN